jgi:hypothetical protein
MQEPKNHALPPQSRLDRQVPKCPATSEAPGGGAERKQKISSSGMGHGDIQERELVTNPATAREGVGLTCRARVIGSARMALEKESGTGRPRWMANIRLLQVQGTPVRLAIPLHIGMADGLGNGKWRMAGMSVEFCRVLYSSSSAEYW